MGFAQRALLMLGMGRSKQSSPPPASPADPGPEALGGHDRPARSSPAAVGNVIYPEQLAKIQTPRSGGELLNQEPLRAFMQDNHFGLGRHNGAVLKSQEALQLGKSELVARFQNILHRIVQGKQFQLGRLEDMKLAIDGIETAMTRRVEAACGFLETEIRTCQEQIQLAGQHAGWVAEALNHYEMGFRQGLAQAVDFEALLQGE